MELDLEIAFTGSEDVMGVIESLVKKVWNTVIPGSVDTNIKFMRMTYNDAMRTVSCLRSELILVRKRQARFTTWHGVC